MRRYLVLLTGVLLLASGCRAPEARWDDALALIVEDLLPRVPAGYTPQLLDTWQVPMEGSLEPMPDAVRDRLLVVSGLPLAGLDVVGSQDSSLILLYLFRPLEVRPDSVLGLGGWMGLTTGDGGSVWGDEFTYVLDCRGECRIRGVEGPIHWN